MKKIVTLLTLTTLNFSSENSNIQSEEKNIPKVRSQEIIITCDNQGYPKTRALRSLAAALYRKQNSKEEITMKEVSGGYFTEKMYIVFSKKNDTETPLFFFKISKKIKSTENLIRIQEGPITEKLQEAQLERSSKKNLPELVLLENIFTYKDNQGNTHTIEVTPSAQGYLIKNILDSENVSAIKKCAFEVGKSLASFHQLFMNYNDSDNPSDWKTICHKDFSMKNALFDPNTNKVYLIDNESMDEASLGVDIKTFLASLMMFYYLKKNNKVRWPLYLEYCQSFLKGYIESYPQDQRGELALFIKKALNDAINKKLNTIIVMDRYVNGKEFHRDEFNKVVYGYLHTFQK